ncbi:sigma-70 family RNA polymerase sigma factor [Saccharibacillus deserti]|uniref:sigma-70 family RNA polymerase sigma factor n=1 Tax=Saccharibacillus deserti TaxID=1634444 RepID=UPI001554C154|nr:sigma-70 family RNA polymerase sigma factor [Saccharibacillus deserti]
MEDNRIREALIRREPEALGRVIERYSGLLWSAVQSVLHSHSHEEVEECVADVFFDLWQKPQAYDPMRASLKTYLAQAARYKAIDRYRKLSREQLVTLRDEEARTVDLLETLERAEESDELRLAIERFPQPDREILYRRFYEGQKPDEISGELSIGVRQVQNRLYRAKLRLREWRRSLKREEREE